MSANKSILSHLFGILRDSQKLAHHCKNPVPIAQHHLIEGSLVSVFKPINQNPFDGYFLCFVSYVVSSTSTQLFDSCSHIIENFEGFASNLLQQDQGKEKSKPVFPDWRIRCFEPVQKDFYKKSQESLTGA